MLLPIKMFKRKFRMQLVVTCWLVSKVINELSNRIAMQLFKLIYKDIEFWKLCLSFIFKFLKIINIACINLSPLFT